MDCRGAKSCLINPNTLAINYLTPSLKALAEAGSTDYVRWQNIKRGKARIGANEIEILGRVFPAYRWLLTGEIAPQIGQTSPDYDEANRNLISPGAG